MSYEWINDYTDLPHRPGAEGPDAYDCYGLLRTAYRVGYGLELPLLDLDYTNAIAILRALMKHPEWDNWEPIPQPEDGALVRMWRADVPNHIGLYVNVDGGGVLHANRVDGVAFHERVELPLLGWRDIQYFGRRA